MRDLVDELRSIDEALQDALSWAGDLAYAYTLDKLLNNIIKVEEAWCGSWFGFRANVYCCDFSSPPLEMFTSFDWEREVNLNSESHDYASWCKYSDAQVNDAIEEGIERSDIRKAFDQTGRWSNSFRTKKDDVLAIIKFAQANHGTLFEHLAGNVEELRIPLIDEFIAAMKPANLDTDDPVAKQQGVRIPPHIRYRAKIQWSIDSAGAVRELSNIVHKTVAQMERLEPKADAPHISGTKVFIGHGRDKSWLELRSFLKEKLELPVTAYEEEPSAGFEIYDNVISRVNEANFAFLVMTGEDTVTDVDGKEKLHPRLNVVHELGICQSKLPKGRVIALVENGCAVPSNIIGFDQIRFDKDRIMSESEKIRDVLAREKIT